MVVVKRSGICVELYCNWVGDIGDIRLLGNEVIIEYFVRFYDVCFVLNNYVVIIDNGDNSIKVYNLVGKLWFVCKFICY